MRKPLAAHDAIEHVDRWLAQPFATLVGPGEKHWRILRSLLLASGAAGNLTSDAHVAALAIEHGASVASADNDFRRFAGVTHVNPLAP
jgi:predicted nucleic acid-binding protein